MAALPGGQSVTGRLHTAAELRRLVEELGFLPLFRGRIPGFSVEEMTAPEDWFSGNPAAVIRFGENSGGERRGVGEKQEECRR